MTILFLVLLTLAVLYFALRLHNLEHAVVALTKVVRQAEAKGPRHSEGDSGESHSGGSAEVRLRGESRPMI